MEFDSKSIRSKYNEMYKSHVFTCTFTPLKMEVIKFKVLPGIAT